jgi:hypothetical protein
MQLAGISPNMAELSRVGWFPAWQGGGIGVGCGRAPCGSAAASPVVLIRSTNRVRSLAPAFSLVEVMTVIAVIMLLMAAGVRLLRDTGPQARRTATDAMTGLIEQARTTALTTRSPVVLAIAEPGDLPTDDGRCMVGLFRLEKWPDGSAPLDGVLLRRWQALPTGVVLLPGGVSGLRNPRDEPEALIRYVSAKKVVEARCHILAFNARGGLLAPAGSDPVALRIAEGSYRGRQPAANASRNDRVAENTLKIGRITARPYHLDG